MSIRGIGVEGVAAQIGAITRGAAPLRADKEVLINTLMDRFEATLDDVLSVLRDAKQCKAIVEIGHWIYLVAD